MNTKWKRAFAAMGMTLAVVFGAPGCEEEKGPAEKAGKAIDDAAHDIKHGVKDATRDIKDDLKKDDAKKNSK